MNSAEDKEKKEKEADEDDSTSTVTWNFQQKLKPGQNPLSDQMTKEMIAFAIDTVSDVLNSEQSGGDGTIEDTEVVDGVDYKMKLKFKGGEMDSINCHVVVFNQMDQHVINVINTPRLTECSCCGSSWKPVDAVKSPLQSIESQDEIKASKIKETASDIKDDNAENEISDASMKTEKLAMNGDSNTKMKGDLTDLFPIESFLKQLN